MHRAHKNPPRSYILLCLALLIATGWLTYAITWREWVAGVDGGGFYLVWALRRAFFGWPDLYHPFYFPWSQELPVLGLGVLGALTYQIATKLKNSLPLMLSNPTCIVVYIVFCAGVLRSHFSSTRYTFFIYPVLLYVVALSLKEVTERVACRVGASLSQSVSIIAAVAYIAFFTVSEDFNPRHIVNIATAEVGFRMAAYERFGRTWYARPDYETPATFLNGLVTPVDGATRLVVVESPPVSYYLKREHAVYYERRGLQFANLSRQRGTVDLMSNNRLLSTMEELQEYTAGARTVWLIRRSGPEAQQPFALQKVWHGRLQDVSRVFLSSDRRIEVLQLQLTAAPHHTPCEAPARARAPQGDTCDHAPTSLPRQ
jgi:hypothetical protein